MWLAVVGSQTFGDCPCLKQPGPKSPEHLRVCPALHAFHLMMATLTRFATRHPLEGVVSGGAIGADSLAKRCAGLLGISPFMELKPRSGPEPFRFRAMERNTRIVRKADVVVAFFAPGDPSPGTSDTVQKARAASKPTYVWRNGSWESSGLAGSEQSASPSTSSP